MSRTKMFFYNSLSSALVQVVTVIVGFVTPRIILQNYGSDINGLVVSITQFIAYFSLVEAGLSSAAVYALYKPLADNNHGAINSIVSAAKKFYTLSGYVFVALTLGMVIIYPMFVKSDSLGVLSVGILVFILGLSGALEFFTMAKYRVLLTADQKLYVLSFASIISIILTAVIVVILAYYKINIIILRLAALTPILLRSLILYIYVKRKYKYIDYNETPNIKALDKRWDAFYLQNLGVVQNGAPVIILTMFVSLKVVSVYSIYNMIIGGMNGILGIFISGLSSSFGDVIAKKELKTLQQSTEEFELSYYGILAIIYSITIVTLMPFIKIYTNGITDTNYNLPFIGFLFVLNGLLYNIKTPQGMLVISAGMFKETRKQSTLQALIIIVFGLILTPQFGIAGVLLASCLSNLYRVIDLLFYIPRNVTKLSVRKTFFRQCGIFASVIIVWLSSRFMNINPQNYLEWTGFAILIGIYSIVVVLLMILAFDRHYLKNIFTRLKVLAGGVLHKNI